MSGQEVLFDEFRSGASAVLSDDGKYRYRLARQWGATARAATFVMLNPSTADATQDDPTIRRCIGFAKSWDLDGLVVVNLYAYRATKPADLWQAADPIGPENDRRIAGVLVDAALHQTPVIAAWGAHGAPLRVKRVTSIAAHYRVPLLCLGTTKAGAPRHPLYVRGDTEPDVYATPTSPKEPTP